MFMAALRWNFVLVTAITATVTAQLIKFIINLILVRKFDPERLWGAGGMPSAHAASVCALAVATGRFNGVHDTMFALALIVAIIVMYDAMGVRWETGKQAHVINRMLEEWMEQGAQFLPILRDQKLKEMVGHTPIQVLTGALLGIGIGFLMPIPA